jgi:putative hydrolase of the HAD superfamily
MIEAAIFDVGGVLIDSPPHVVSTDLSRELGIDKAVIDGVWEDLIPLLGSGKIDEKEFWARFRKIHKIRLVSTEENLLGKAFIETLKNNEVLLEFIQELGGNGIKLAVLSNTIEPHAKPIRESGILEPFDYVFNSHEVGLRKPDPAIYKYALKVIEVKPQNTLFVDDDPENVEAGERLGIHGIVALSPQQVIKDVKQLID